MPVGSNARSAQRTTKKITGRQKPVSALRHTLAEEQFEEEEQEAAETDAGEIAQMLSLFQASLLKKKNEKVKQVETAIKEKLDAKTADLQEKIENSLGDGEVVSQEHKRKRDEKVDTVVVSVKKVKAAFEVQVGEQIEGLEELERQIMHNSKAIRTSLGAWDNLGVSEIGFGSRRELEMTEFVSRIAAEQKADLDVVVEQIQEERSRYRMLVKKKAKEQAAGNIQKAFSLALGV
ncbi:hypothetical protein M427DRAFT_28531 [Gonapodya prolifera JEL478]|uniref:Uncharacterized protein n=1 Tax=Gonapodya prolifera (strain JEL478) TaxID=1344416 RepID=A0A139AU69_GONPJ|nr:hypothetical protein M427DRAFT_28531 [Gonapodya prolifera JEL478]|eukprot:KXS20249.1 hypothetical protein M427DRAFT_28531 [Gonapodya prolifera JEL478]